MKCPKCNKNRLKYNQERISNDDKLDHKRIDFSVKCQDCGYLGKKIVYIIIFAFIVIAISGYCLREYNIERNYEIAKKGCPLMTFTRVIWDKTLYNHCVEEIKMQQGYITDAQTEFCDKISWVANHDNIYNYTIGRYVEANNSFECWEIHGNVTIEWRTCHDCYDDSLCCNNDTLILNKIGNKIGSFTYEDMIKKLKMIVNE